MNVSLISRSTARWAISIALTALLPAVAIPAEPISLNFKDAEIESVVGAFGHLLNRTFVVDPRVRGKITLETPKPVSREQAFTLLKTMLRQQGFAVVDQGALVKIVPEADAKLQQGPVQSGRRGTRQGDEIVTQIFQLHTESASNLVPILRPLISPNNTITAFPNNNTLVVTDYAGNLERIGRIIASLDSVDSKADVAVIPVKHMIASDLAAGLSKLLDDSQRAGANVPGAATDPGQRVIVLADPRTNSLLLRSSSPSKMRTARELVKQLDQPAGAEQANMRVVYLRNAEALKLVEVLRAVLTGDGSGQGGQGGQTGSRSNTGAFGGNSSFGGGNSAFGGGSGSAFGQSQGSNTFGFGQGGQQGGFGQGMQGGQGGQGNQQQSPVTINAGGAIIAADPSTNALIITAPEPVYRNIRAVIDQLDVRRAQVHIESLIVEVSAKKAAELGVQWQFMTNSTEGRNAVIGGTNFGSGGSNIAQLSTNPSLLAGGLNIGLVRAGNFLGAAAGTINLGLLARALESDTDTNIKATPNLLTLDNEEAKIIIGQNVPFVTGSYGSVVGTASAPFTTVERKDVGTMLRVRPQVSEGGTVKMQIFQEVSSVVGNAGGNQGLITNRRAIESNVLVDDGQIIVLGGLIEDQLKGSINKIPLLGDIPILGQLFRYDNRERQKTNLMVFLRPVVVRDERGSWDVTANRYDYMRRSSIEGQFDRRPGLSTMRQPDMQPLPSRPGTPGAPIPPREPASIAPTIDLRQRTQPMPGSEGATPTAPHEPLSQPSPSMPTNDQEREASALAPSGRPGSAPLTEVPVDPSGRPLPGQPSNLHTMPVNPGPGTATQPGQPMPMQPGGSLRDPQISLPRVNATPWREN